MGPRAAPLFFFFFSWPPFVFFIFTGLSMPRRPRTCPTRRQRWDGIICPRRLRAFACWPHQSPGGTPRSPRLRFSNCSKQSPKSRHPIEWRAETRRCQPPSFHTNDSGFFLQRKGEDTQSRDQHSIGYISVLAGNCRN